MAFLFRSRLRLLSVVMAVGGVVPWGSYLWGGGVTLITHGFNGNVTDWIIPMAEEISGHPEFRGSSVSCYEIDVRKSGDGYTTEAKLLNGILPQDADSGEIVIKLDWSTEAGLLGASSTQVAEAASVALRSVDLIAELEGRPLAESPLHLIGHSRGGSVVSEIARLLGEEGIWVDQLTTLDPVPVPAFGDAAVAVRENVLFADNYYQQIGGFLVPTGSPIEGAFNRKLTELGGGYSSPHSDAHLWYHGTIELVTPSTDTQATVTASQRNSWWEEAELKGAESGFRYSRLGQGDRTSELRPGGEGTDRVVEGYNQRWDFGAGEQGNRAPLENKADQWPNVIHAAVASNVVFDRLALTWFHQTEQVENPFPELQVWLDGDRNPWNGNERLLEGLPVAGSGRSEVVREEALVSLRGVAEGVHSVLLRLRHEERSRYLYLMEDIEVVAPPAIAAETMAWDEAGLQFEVTGSAGTTVAVWMSEDLEQWQMLATGDLTDSPWLVRDETARAEEARYYRLALP